jgi:hypothetical protein
LSSVTSEALEDVAATSIIDHHTRFLSPRNHRSELVADAGEDMYGRRRGEKALHRVSRTSGVRRKGAKCLVGIIEQIVDLDEPRELLPACPDSTIHNEVVT